MCHCFVNTVFFELEITCDYTCTYKPTKWVIVRLLFIHTGCGNGLPYESHISISFLACVFNSLIIMSFTCNVCILQPWHMASYLANSYCMILLEGNYL